MNDFRVGDIVACNHSFVNRRSYGLKAGEITKIGRDGYIDVMVLESSKLRPEDEIHGIPPETLKFADPDYDATDGCAIASLFN